MIFNYEKLHELRVFRGMTTEELGKKCGTSQSMVCRWESGKRKPRPDKLDALCKALNCEKTDLAFFPIGLLSRPESLRKLAEQMREIAAGLEEIAKVTK